MIISVSRRSDIPAFYADWFMNRIRAGYCTVPNPFNPNQISHVSLKPEDVEVIVFWTRNPAPLLPYLPELDRRGYNYYFLFTLMHNPRLLEVNQPSFSTSISNFRQLSDTIGPEKVIWRYDPIILSNISQVEFHAQAYLNIARMLKGYTNRSIISLVDLYRKTRQRLYALSRQGLEILPWDEISLARLIGLLVDLARSHGLDIYSCAEDHDVGSLGIIPGKCIDDNYILKTFGIAVNGKKDSSQRKPCGCVVSKDIGMYDTCLSGCQYCYATTSFEQAKLNYRAHDPGSASLINRNCHHAKNVKDYAAGGGGISNL
jgi:hypothetical protein